LPEENADLVEPAALLHVGEDRAAISRTSRSSPGAAMIDRLAAAGRSAESAPAA
jgi:hypothetical protein